jgi:hydrogenase maturation protein HypF
VNLTRVELAQPVPPVLALGAFLKNTVCLAADREAHLAPDLGNLDEPEALAGFHAAVDALVDRVTPVAIAHDLHPDFYSSRYAVELSDRLGAPAVAVQHHHAHTAAVMAEHGRSDATLGLSLDGFGLGPNHESWGGELLRVDANGYERLGHLAHLAQPGADAASRQPWRMGAAALHAIGRGDEIAGRFADFPGAGMIPAMIDRGVNSPRTSSAGRLFDAACGLLGVKPVVAFEGEAPMQLESMVETPRVVEEGWRIEASVLDLTPLLAAIADCEAKDGAELFHGTLIEALTAWVAAAADETGVRSVALSGGCMLNRVLREGLLAGLTKRDIEPLLPIALSPGDPAISLGQAWAAALGRA